MKLSLCVGIALAAAVFAGPAFADRIIFAPTGTVLGPGEFKAEGAVNPSDNDGKAYWLALGLQRLEISGMRLENSGGLIGASGDVDVFGAQIAMLPETTLTPGISIGVWDFTKKTDDGIGFYGAISKTVPLTDQLPLPIQDVKVHAGIGTKGLDGLFGGAEAAIPFGLKLSAEYFRKEFNFAVGWQPVPSLQFKVYFLDDETFYGVRFAPQI